MQYTPYPPRWLSIRLAARLGLPVTPLRLRFNDSANWIWYSNGHALKLARTRMEDSTFWYGAYYLFGLDRYAAGARLRQILSSLATNLPVPPTPMTWRGRIDGSPLWQQSWQKGRDVEWSDDFAHFLGRQCAALQKQRGNLFGRYPNATRSLSQWPLQVQRFLHQQGTTLSDTNERETLAGLTLTPPAPSLSAVPLLLDLREDQFLFNAGRYYWLDWEAMVWAPLEFAWALYEVLVPASCRDAFIRGCNKAQRPDLTGYREHARAVFYLMNAFGHEQLSSMEDIPPWVEPFHSC